MEATTADNKKDLVSDSPVAKATGEQKRVKKTSTTKAKAVVKDLQKLRIRVSAYENKILDASVKQIIDTALRHDGQVCGPVPLPTEIKKYTVNRSSFIDKNSREQFEMRIHKRLVDITNPSARLIESLTNLNLPSGVNVDVKMM